MLSPDRPAHLFPPPGIRRLDQESRERRRESQRSNNTQKHRTEETISLLGNIRVLFKKGFCCCCLQLLEKMNWVCFAGREHLMRQLPDHQTAGVTQRQRPRMSFHGAYHMCSVFCASCVCVCV